MNAQQGWPGSVGGHGKIPVMESGKLFMYLCRKEPKAPPEAPEEKRNEK